MGVTLPIAAVNTANVDANTDNPSLARADILDLINKVNSVLANLSTAAGAGVVVVRDGSGKVAGDITGAAASASSTKDADGTGTAMKCVENGLKVIRGTVNANGTIANGSGFSVVKQGTGSYAVTYSTAFSAQPVTVATAYGNDPTSFAQVMSDGTAYSSIRTAVNNASADNKFSFIAIGLI